MNEFLKFFNEGDVAGAAAFIETHPLDHTSNTAHPWLRECVDQNGGRCHQKAHLEIAEMLTSELVCEFRDSVLNDRIDEVTQWLCQDPKLTEAEFTAGRGIGRAMHHWKSVEMAEVLLDVSAGLDSLNSHEETPVAMQLRFGSLNGTRFLLERGADPNLGISAHIPSESLDVSIELLLKHGWDINRGQLLHDAKHGHCARVQTWLKHGVNPNVTDENGETALHLLATRGVGQEAMQALVDAGAKLDSKNQHGQSPLNLARKADKQVAADLLARLGAV